jgi:hypothetical protein
MCSTVLRRRDSDMGAIDPQSRRNSGPPRPPDILAGLRFGSGFAFARILERRHLHIYQLTGLQVLTAKDRYCPPHRPNVAPAEWSILTDS